MSVMQSMVSGEAGAGLTREINVRDPQQLWLALEQIVQNIATQGQVNEAIVQRLLAAEAAVAELQKEREKLQQRMQTLIASGGFGRQVSVYVGQDLVLTRALGRLKMFVNPKRQGSAAHLIADGYWQMAATKVFQGLVGPGKRVLDLGAESGYYTLVACAELRGGGRVDVFDGDSENLELLKQNLEINSFSTGAGYDVRLYGKAGFSSEDAGQLVGAGVDVVRVSARFATAETVDALAELVERRPGIRILWECNPARRISSLLPQFAGMGLSVQLITELGTVGEPLSLQAVPSDPRALLLLQGA